MTPKVERVPPPFMQIAERFRANIREGALEQGAQLPSIPAIARDAGVATATAAKAVQQLQREGYVRTSNQGTFVDVRGRTTRGSDRLQMTRANGVGLLLGESVEVIGAELIPVSGGIADALNTADGGEVIRRRRVYRDDRGPAVVSTSWLPGNLLDAAPELLDAGPLPTMTFGLIEERTGRRVVRRSDRISIRPAPSDVAPHLGVTIGASVLTMENRYWDQNGDPVEYALDHLGAGREVSAEYNI